MSVPQPPKLAKLVIGVFMQNRDLMTPIASKLGDAFGAIDTVSPWYPFDFTTYYHREMGFPLFRRVLSFQSLIEQDSLAEIKVFTNGIEKHYTISGKRSVNLDPGYLVHERFVLATGKNFAHRIYIGKGIYADLTLLYQKGTFVSLPWTYPDYAHNHLISFLERTRKKYVRDIKNTLSMAENPNAN